MKFYYYSIFILVFGCSNNLSSDSFVGEYSFNDSSLDSLFLSKNHTYIHKYIASDGRTFTCKGKWEFRKGPNDIVFEDFTFFNDSGPDFAPGAWIVKVKIEAEKSIKLMYSSENNIYFEKKQSQ